jgi:hypothetical protein
VVEKSEKLLDWALLALVGGDKATARSLYKQYANYARNKNPALAAFYEHLLDDDPFASGIVLDTEHPEFSPRSDLTLDNVDNLLIASLSALKNGCSDVFFRTIIHALQGYNEILRRSLTELADMGERPNSSEDQLLIDIVERLKFSVDRLHDTYTRDKQIG